MSPTAEGRGRERGFLDPSGTLIGSRASSELTLLMCEGEDIYSLLPHTNPVQLDWTEYSVKSPSFVGVKVQLDRNVFERYFGDRKLPLNWVMVCFSTGENLTRERKLFQQYICDI